MAPTTRSKSRKAAVAGFPDPTQPTNTSRMHELRPLEMRNPAQFDPVPPKYTIDLSRPPRERYNEVVADFKPQLTKLTGLFDEVLIMTGLPVKATTRFARLFLRRVRSKEETEELRGISKASGVPMHLLVSFNSLLDLFMGCTSGGARVRTGDSSTTMHHFRTLDWEMDVLRRVVVQLEFVDRPHGAVVARSVTYVGYVGVLTGVRRGLSASLNFRPYHNDDLSGSANVKFYSNLLLMLLGFRPSISSRLRELVIPRVGPRRRRDPDRKGLWDLATVKERFPALPTTAAYLIFSDGYETAVLEKDRVTATVRSSSSFIAITNCDVDATDSSDKAAKKPRAKLDLLKDLIEEAEDRRVRLETCWNSAKERCRRRGIRECSVPPEDVVKWVQRYPTTNETTHYAVVMDPKAGEVVWAKRWLEGEATQSGLDSWDQGWTCI
ncbi:major facilitator superfamily [Diplodia corticola]|uniref:ceramidase n=1 Tax=Diplodia corticola TaxID=236234 RepID=A0A1J9QQR4_9PEZI|nr:major facilitator superfamily [Diplodia corticola]OJD31278.1 major facilitator superfamily [Diplodia corticola]